MSSHRLPLRCYPCSPPSFRTPILADHVVWSIARSSYAADRRLRTGFYRSASRCRKRAPAVTFTCIEQLRSAPFTRCTDKPSYLSHSLCTLYISGDPAFCAVDPRTLTLAPLLAQDRFKADSRLHRAPLFGPQNKDLPHCAYTTPGWQTK